MSNAGMLLKAKDRCGKGWAEAGMLLIAKEISSESGNVIENKEDRRFLKAVTRTCCRPLRPPLTGPCRPSNTTFGSVILSAAERSEESRSGLFRRQTAGRDASPAGRDQHGSEGPASRRRPDITDSHFRLSMLRMKCQPDIHSNYTQTCDQHPGNVVRIVFCRTAPIFAVFGCRSAPWRWAYGRAS